jgi:hypothetical protein
MFSDVDKMVAATLTAAVIGNAGPYVAGNAYSATLMYAQVLADLEEKGLIGTFTAEQADTVGRRVAPSILGAANSFPELVPA